MEQLPDTQLLANDIDILLKKHNIEDAEHYLVLKEFLLCTLLYHWEDPLIADLIPLKEGIEEIRKAMNMFKRYRYDLKISVFGSARTPQNHPLYHLTMDFSNKAALKGYKIITGAGPGIMEAGNLGAGADNSFGLGLKLPYENENEIFKERPDHITIFNNFYSRKHTFYREADAVVVLPGGYGTMDEVYQGLTTLQTGKKRITPFILLDEPNGVFWTEFDEWIERNMQKGYISALDRSMYNICTSADETLKRIDDFYKVFHSYLTLNESELFFQLKKKLSPAEEKILNKIAFDNDLTEMTYVRERYYPETTLYVYQSSLKKLRDFVKIKLFIEQINQSL